MTTQAPVASPPVAAVTAISPLTPHNKALYDAGKALLVESIEVGREFCKFMIGVCSGAIPIYLGLLKFLLPEHYTLSWEQGLVFAAPTVLFLVGSVVFAIGYFPQQGHLSLDLPSEIERERSITIQRRRRLAFLGFSAFVLGTVAAVVVAIWALALPIVVTRSGTA